MPVNYRGNSRAITRVCWETDVDWDKGTIPSELERFGTGDGAVIRLSEVSDNDNDIPYTTAGNYTLSDGSKLEVAAGLARLKAVSGSSNDIPFTTSGNYTFDAGSVVVTGGIAKLIGSDGLVDSLEAYYKMDEASWNGTSGEVTDSSLNTNDGTAVGDATTVAGGKIGRAGTFDGTNDSVSIPHDASLSFETTDSFSFACWVKVSSGGNRALMAKQQVSGSVGTNLAAITSGKVRMNLIGSTGSLAVDTTNLVDDDAYHHVVMTYNGNEDVSGVKIYIDGSSETLSTVANALSGSIVTSVVFRLGNREADDQDYAGLLDEVGVWSKELTSAQVTSLYNSGSGLELDFFPIDNPSIRNNTGISFAAAFNTFTETSTKTGSDEIKYQLSSDDGTIYKWWNGSSWVARQTISLPTAVTTTVGTVTGGNLASLQSVDADTYDIDEISGTPGLTTQFDFSNVSVGPATVSFYSSRIDPAMQPIDVEIWNFNTSGWDDIGDLPINGSITFDAFTVGGTPSDYIENGVVKIRLNHAANGAPAHSVSIDQVFLDSAPSDEWWYDNESNDDSTVNANVSTLAASGTLKVNSFLHSDDGSTTPELDNINVEIAVTYSTDDNLHIDTKDAAQISPSTVITWLTTTISSTLPGSTDSKLLFSVDGRVSWLTWGGSSWDAPASATARVNATSFSDAVTNFASLPVGSEILDVRLFLFTSDNSVRPLVTNINVTSDGGVELSGVYETNQVDSTNIDNPWDIIEAKITLGSGGSVVIKAKAANSTAEVTVASYGSALNNGDDSGVVGQFIQFQITITGDGTETTSIDRLCVDFENLARGVISP